MSNDPSETGRSPGGRPPEEQGALPNGVRPLDSLRVRDALQLGEEARDLARILQAKVPVATGYLVRLGDEQEARLRAVIAETLAAGNGVRLRPLFPTLGAAQRFERRLPRLPDIAQADQVEAVVGELLAAVAAPELRAALGGSLASLRVRVIACDPGSGGKGASADPLHGDPDELGVWSYASGAAVWRIDRRSGRIIHPGDGLDG